MFILNKDIAWSMRVIVLIACYVAHKHGKLIFTQMGFI